jgi:hypothetical protein
LIRLDTAVEQTVTNSKGVEKEKEVSPTTTSSEVSNVKNTATTSNALAPGPFTLKDVSVGDGNQLGKADDASQNSIQRLELQSSDGETIQSEHAAAVSRLFGDPVMLSELDKFLLYGEEGSTLIGVVQLYLQPVEMGTNGKCVQLNTLEM